MRCTGPPVRMRYASSKKYWALKRGRWSMEHRSRTSVDTTLIRTWCTQRIWSAECRAVTRPTSALRATAMATATAADRVAKSLGVPIYETPTGWKYFGGLMDAGLCTMCGEESFGTGSNHIREKDGFWAVLCWISILCGTRKSVAQVMDEHWSRFGRSYFQRHDYEGLEAHAAAAMLAEIDEALPSLRGRKFGEGSISQADDFTYTDPVDHSVTTKAGIRILLDDGSRAVFRLSGTGTEGATLRVYLERFSKDYHQETSQMVAPLARSIPDLLRLQERFGRDEPDVVT